MGPLGIPIPDALFRSLLLRYCVVLIDARLPAGLYGFSWFYNALLFGAVKTSVMEQRYGMTSLGCRHSSLPRFAPPYLSPGKHHVPSLSSRPFNTQKNSSAHPNHKNRRKETSKRNNGSIKCFVDKEGRT
jgi:hypothetical protein